MPSTDRKLELTAKASMAQPVSQTAVCSNGLTGIHLIMTLSRTLALTIQICVVCRNGTRRRVGGEANGVGSQMICGSQYNSILPRHTVYPTLLPTIKTCDKLPSSVVIRELSSKIIQLTL